jgi:hypothetical protein
VGRVSASLTRRGAAPAVVAVLCAAALAGCGDSPSGSSSPPPPAFPPPPVVAPPPPPVAPPPAAGGDYPLTQQQAIADVEAGVAVAGRASNGVEVVIRRLTETTTERRQVLENVCEQEYDTYEQRYKTKCHDKYVDRYVPVTKTYYQLSGALSDREQMVLGAFAQATAIGARTYRIAR